jgi:Helix-turn-helix domain
MKPVAWMQRLQRDSGLSSHSRHVALALGTHSTGTRTPWSDASHSQIAEWTGLSVSTVKRALKELRTGGWLTPVKQTTAAGGFARNRYLLLNASPDPLVHTDPRSYGTQGWDLPDLTLGSLGTGPLGSHRPHMKDKDPSKASRCPNNAGSPSVADGSCCGQAHAAATNVAPGRELVAV